jgi:hypothetical protein
LATMAVAVACTYILPAWPQWVISALVCMGKVRPIRGFVFVWLYIKKKKKKSNTIRQLNIWTVAVELYSR